MRFDGNFEDEKHKGKTYNLDSKEVAYFDRNLNVNDDDHYPQPKGLFEEVMIEEQQQNTISNSIGSMSRISGEKKVEIINRQLGHWFRVSPKLGAGIAKELQVNIEEYLKKQN